MENAKEEYINAWDYIEIYHSECGWKKLSQVWRVSRHQLRIRSCWNAKKVGAWRMRRYLGDQI
jgi:hypothetical protein